MTLAEFKRFDLLIKKLCPTKISTALNRCSVFLLYKLMILRFLFLILL